MYPSLISGVPPIWTTYKGRKISTEVDKELLEIDLPWAVDADDSDVFRQDTDAPAECEHKPEARVPMTMPSCRPEESTGGREIVRLIDVSGGSAIAIPATVMSQFSEPTEKLREDNELDRRTMLTRKTLNHIAQILWGFRLPFHPSYSPEVVLESFVFFHHHNMSALAGRTYAWLLWYFIEHQHCPNDLLLTRAWQITSPGHSLRPLLLSSLWHRLAEIPDSPQATIAFKNKFNVMYAHRYAPSFIDLRPGSWFADFHAFFGQATNHQLVLDETLARLVNVEANKISPNGIDSYIRETRDDLRSILTGKVAVSPSVLSAPDSVKSNFRTHMDALCAYTSQTEGIEAKALIEPELQPADTLQGTVWQLDDGTMTGLVTWKDVIESPAKVNGAMPAARDTDKTRATSISDESHQGKMAAEDADQLRATSNPSESKGRTRAVERADKAKVTSHSDESNRRKRPADDEVSSDTVEANSQGSPTKRARRDAELAGTNEANISGKDSDAAADSAVDEIENVEVTSQGLQVDATNPGATSAPSSTATLVKTGSNVRQHKLTQGDDIDGAQRAVDVVPYTSSASAKGPAKALKRVEDASHQKTRPKATPKKVPRKSIAERESLQQQQQARDEQRAKDSAAKKEAAARKSRAGASRYDAPSARRTDGVFREDGNGQIDSSPAFGEQSPVANSRQAARDRSEGVEGEASSARPGEAAGSITGPSARPSSKPAKQPQGETQKSTPLANASAAAFEDSRQSHATTTPPSIAPATSALDTSSSIKPVVDLTQDPESDSTGISNAQIVSEPPTTWTDIQEAGTAGDRAGLIEFTLRLYKSKSVRAQACYMNYAILQAKSSLYAEMPLATVVQPVDLSTDAIVHPRVLERVCKILLGECEKETEARASMKDKVEFCVAASALGCRDLVEQILGPREDWEKGFPLPDHVAVLAYRSVMALKDEQGRSPMPAQQRAKLGGKALWDWVALKMAVKARKAGMSTQVPDFLKDVDMNTWMREKLIADVRREVHNLKLEKLDRLAGYSG